MEKLNSFQEKKGTYVLVSPKESTGPSQIILQ